jgi:hypothetical protein
MYTVELDTNRAVARLHGIRMRADDPFAEPRLMRALEASEKRHFKRLRGKYIRTGRLFQSLTGQSADAIRDVRGDVAHFGTRVPYAKLAANRGGDPLLMIDRIARRQIARDVLDYVVQPRWMSQPRDARGRWTRLT